MSNDGENIGGGWIRKPDGRIVGALHGEEYNPSLHGLYPGQVHSFDYAGEPRDVFGFEAEPFGSSTSDSGASSAPISSSSSADYKAKVHGTSDYKTLSSNTYSSDRAIKYIRDSDKHRHNRAIIGALISLIFVSVPYLAEEVRQGLSRSSHIYAFAAVAIFGKAALTYAVVRGLTSDPGKVIFSWLICLGGLAFGVFALNLVLRDNNALQQGLMVLSVPFYFIGMTVVCLGLAYFPKTKRQRG